MIARPAALSVVVPPDAAGMRLDRFLATIAALGTRTRAKQLIDDGLVLVDGSSRKSAHAVRAGERIAITLPPPEPSTLVPEALPVSILYEDEFLVAIDKPPGMVVHPAPGARRGTVVHALLHRLGALPGAGAPERPGIVHRLDRDTSGVLVVARTAAALEGLARQFRERTLQKRYLAIVHGRVGPMRGTVDRPIGRDPKARKQMSVRSPRGRAAVTHYEVLERLPGATYLGLRPETGRTHQLRVHLAALGHPIVGDRVYGGTRTAGRSTASAVLAACARQALHAESLAFTHPTLGTPVVVRAALPADMASLLAALRVTGPGSA